MSCRRFFSYSLECFQVAEIEMGAVCSWEVIPFHPWGGDDFWLDVFHASSCHLPSTILPHFHTSLLLGVSASA